MVTINSYEEFLAYEGKEVGVSEWVEITQKKINQFADATDDHQWIHAAQSLGVGQNCGVGIAQNVALINA
ncbi:MAG: hypothetical protein IIU52_03070, partial [Bacteroidaceae bacterium]|nr:hypothetical protein [Bacteroidaceae bacterium]